ncbi:MAG: hypothetical protein OXU68_01775 [Bacteroidota bacterium]|nr:hypothetical protein [Bacteroidota bacterium]
MGKWKIFDRDFQEDHFSYTRNEEAFDGMYALRTTLDQQPTDTVIVAYFKRLAVVETAFRTLKSVSLKVRPISPPDDQSCVSVHAGLLFGVSPAQSADFNVMDRRGS